MSRLLNADEMHADGCSHVRPTHSLGLRLIPRRPAVLRCLTNGLDAKPRSVDHTAAPLYTDFPAFSPATTTKRNKKLSYGKETVRLLHNIEIRLLH